MCNSAVEKFSVTSRLVGGFALEAWIEKSERLNLTNLGLFLGQMGLC